MIQVKQYLADLDYFQDIFHKSKHKNKTIDSIEIHT